MYNQRPVCPRTWESHPIAALFKTMSRATIWCNATASRRILQYLISLMGEVEVHSQPNPINCRDVRYTTNAGLVSNYSSRAVISSAARTLQLLIYHAVLSIAGYFALGAAATLSGTDFLFLAQTA